MQIDAMFGPTFDPMLKPVSFTHFRVLEADDALQADNCQTCNDMMKRQGDLGILDERLEKKLLE